MKNKFRQYAVFFTMLTTLVLFNSCIGISMDIQMNRDGSGKLTLEYRMSKMLDNLGKLDGNVSLPSIPVGQTDWKKTVDRIPGLKLVSFASKDETRDTVYKIILDFDNEKALLQFLSPLSDTVLLTNEGKKGRLDLLVLDSAPSYDKNMMDLISILSADYKFSVSLSAPLKPGLILNDANGNSLTPMQSAKIVQSGKKVSFSIDTLDILELKNGLKLIFNW
ncbi:MAG: hypothetical protein FWB95_01950 [Treponema sp.]|nr:hypothetical protein [Treponema sp.]